jgi:8-oxo-dGTP diphosphatase
LLVAAAALIDAEGKILLAQRPEGKAMAGLWEFPGGKVGKDETPEAALVRELREELGIETSTGCLWPLTFGSHAYPDFHLLMPVFSCRVWQGMPHAREGQKLAWVTKAELKNYEMPPADVGLVQTLWTLL